MLAPAQFQYNHAVAESWNQQLLLNIIRLHYRDTPVFLKTDQIVAGYTFERSASVGLEAIPGVLGLIDQASASVGGTLEERPTVTLSPLNDMEFTGRLLSPIPPETLLLMAASGWQIERVMICCVREINSMQNLPATLDAGLEPPASFPAFREAAQRLEELQRAGELQWRVTTDGESGQSELSSGPRGNAALRSIIGLAAGPQPIQLTRPNGIRLPEELEISGRSLMDVFTFLSRYVESPIEHRERGMVQPTAAETRAEAGPWLRILSSSSRPTDAFVSVSYQGYWFFIPSDDLDAKETFGLMTQLFSLQASEKAGRSPLITIPAG